MFGKCLAAWNFTTLARTYSVRTAFFLVSSIAAAVLGSVIVNTPFFEARRHLIRVDLSRKGDRPAEGAVGALGIIVVLAFFLPVFLLLAPDGERIAGDGEVNVLVAHARQFRRHGEGLCVLG